MPPFKKNCCFTKTKALEPSPTDIKKSNSNMLLLHYNYEGFSAPQKKNVLVEKRTLLRKEKALPLTLYKS